MKQILMSLFFPLVVLIASCNQSGDGKTDVTDSTANQKTTLQIKGSDTMLPMIQKEAENFKGGAVSVTGGGSGVGIQAMEMGQTDICMASRDLKDDEKIKLDSMGKKVTTTIVGYDALSIIVNPLNKVSKLTKEQLKDIFTGKITNWKQVGGKDMKIVVISRESSSGTYEYFKEKVMDKMDYTKDALMKPSTGAIDETVGQTEGAIGYVGLAYLTEGKNIKAIDVSWDGGKTFVTPSIVTAMDKTYPISRPLFLMYDNTLAATVTPFVNYVLSAEGQAIVKEIGYIPLQ